MIKVIDFVETAFSVDDAIKIENAFMPIINHKGKVVVDFDGINIFTTMFFNNAFAKYVVELGVEKYHEVFLLINLTELGEVTYRISYDNAVCGMN